MKYIPWFHRSFDFSSQQIVFSSVLERLSGTPARLAEKVALIPENISVMRIEGSWTIKENVGHLSDLEPLWQARLQDILQGNRELTIADLQNRTTHEAHHNLEPVSRLVHRFRQMRKQTVVLLEQLTDEQVQLSALHPRLQTPMRIVDLCWFVAEHDDHHLARISQLVKSLAPST